MAVQHRPPMRDPRQYRTPSRGGTGEETMTNLALGALAVAVAAGAVLLAGVELATWLATGHTVRGTKAYTHVLGVLAHAGSPARAFPAGSGVPGAAAVWSTVAGVVLCPALALGLVVLLLRRAGRRNAHLEAASGLNRRPGMATRGDVRQAMKGLDAELERAADLRKVLVGRVHGAPFSVSSQQSVLVEGPARSGKTSCLMIPSLVEWDGPAVATSTKDDVFRFTAALRAQRGPIWVFDPERAAGRGGFGWSPLSGCQDRSVALRRADELVKAAAPTDGAENGGFFAGQAKIVARCLLHAAALEGVGLAEVLSWVMNPKSIRPVQLLDKHGATLDATALNEQRNAPEKTRQSVWMTLGLCFEWATPEVIRACETVPACGGFDATRLLTEGGTLYIQPSEHVQSNSQVLLATLLGEVVRTAIRLTDGISTTGRLDPPLLLALDEVANIAPWPGLPGVLSQSGGQGICALLGLQNAAQALGRWGQHGGKLVVESCTTRLVFPGLKSANELQDLSTLVGNRDEQTLSRSRQTGPRAEGGGSTSQSMRRVRTLEPDEIFALPHRSVLVVPNIGKASVLSVVHYSQRACAAAVAASDVTVREMYSQGADVTAMAGPQAVSVA